MTTPISFELAKMLKEKGFDKSTEANWWILAKDHQFNYIKGLPVDESKIFFTKNSNELESITQIDEETEHNVYHVMCCPTITQTVMWLYEKRRIWIIVTPIPYSDNLTHWRWEHVSTEYTTRNMKWKKQQDYMSPTEAYEAAIEYVLTKLI